PEGVELTVLDTGADTPTGGRVLAASQHLTSGPGGRFHLTYADGVADIDLSALVARHEQVGATMTVTVVRPELNFGVADVDGSGMVTGFREKPVAEFSVNGGFMLCEPRVMDHLTPDAVLERDPFERLAAAGDLAASPHHGFWACLDTPKDLAVLEGRWEQGAPWIHEATRAAADTQDAAGAGTR
ncbi:MAG: sugar phosphate nucleotidyltransferase, partial [Patulibacter sp.]|nr:sugar phosphate nucleotidyltransferase [Patulibacter sp.]